MASFAHADISVIGWSCIGCGHLPYEYHPVNGLPLNGHNTSTAPHAESISFRTTRSHRETQDADSEDEHTRPQAMRQKPCSEEETRMYCDVDERQAQGARPPPTPTQQALEARGPSKRSLNMHKCDRCRLDKKKVRGSCMIPRLSGQSNC